MPDDATNDAYRDIARWYDIEHDAVTADIECYQELINAEVGPQAAVLEIGSGTGRTAAALAAAGFSVTGIEPSPAMRARCEKRLAALPERVARRVRVVAGSATAPGLAPAARYAVVLFGLNTLAHLTTPAARHAALLAARAHLTPDGIVIIDVDLAGPRKLAERLGMLWLQGTWPLPDAPSGETLAHLVAARPADQPDVLRLTHFYDVAEQGGSVRRTIATMDIAVLSSSELALALLHAGFAQPTTYGGYDLAPLDGDSPRLVALARQ